jgi:organic radical activating enzyme
MDANAPELPFLTTIGCMLTYKCTIACPHCIAEAGPRRKEEMPLEQCLAWIDAAGAYRDGHVRGLALTGGEPFYNIPNLTRISDHGQALGLIVSVVTNAYWATSPETALSVLAGLPALQLISVSTDVYHQKAIPFERVKNAVWAARELGRLYNISVCTDNEDDPRYLKIMDDLREIVEPDRIRTAVTLPVGRALKALRHLNYRTASTPTVAACSAASTPVIFPDGRVHACIGPLLTLPTAHPMVLGSLYRESLPEILDRAELNPVLHILRAWGPHKLVSLLSERGLQELLPAEYICDCVCDVCYKLLADERIVAALADILQEDELRETVAYARWYYLGETTMAELYGLGAN